MCLYRTLIIVLDYKITALLESTKRVRLKAISMNKLKLLFGRQGCNFSDADPFMFHELP